MPDRFQKTSDAWVTLVAGRLTARPCAADALALLATMCTPPRACPTCSSLQFSFLRLHRAQQASSAAPPSLPRSFAVAELKPRCKNAHYTFTVAPLRPPLARRHLRAVNQPQVRPHSAFPRRRNLAGVGCSVASPTWGTSSPSPSPFSFPVAP